MIELLLNETPNPRYVFINPKTGTLHLMVPVSILEQQAFFGKKHDSAVKKDSALDELLRLIIVLEDDINIMSDSILKSRKILLLRHAKNYVSALNIIMPHEAFNELCLADPAYPAPIKEIFAQVDKKQLRIHKHQGADVFNFSELYNIDSLKSKFPPNVHRTMKQSLLETDLPVYLPDPNHEEIGTAMVDDKLFKAEIETEISKLDTNNVDKIRQYLNSRLMATLTDSGENSGKKVFEWLGRSFFARFDASPQVQILFEELRSNISDLTLSKNFKNTVQSSTVVHQLLLTPEMCRCLYTSVVATTFYTATPETMTLTSQYMTENALEQIIKAYFINNENTTSHLRVQRMSNHLPAITACQKGNFMVTASSTTISELDSLINHGKNKFHLTRPMARSLYQEVGSRFGIKGKEYEQMQSLFNDPHPNKILYALQLLNIDIDRAAFSFPFNGKGENGYILSGVTPEMINKISSIHGSRGLRYQITKEMAQAIYVLVDNRGSTGLLNNLNNTDRPDQLETALIHLGITYDRVELNNFDGYFIYLNSTEQAKLNIIARNAKIHVPSAPNMTDEETLLRASGYNTKVLPIVSTENRKFRLEEIRSRIAAATESEVVEHRHRHSPNPAEFRFGEGKKNTIKGSTGASKGADGRTVLIVHGMDENHKEHHVIVRITPTGDIEVINVLNPNKFTQSFAHAMSSSSEERQHFLKTIHFVTSTPVVTSSAATGITPPSADESRATEAVDKHAQHPGGSVIPTRSVTEQLKINFPEKSASDPDWDVEAYQLFIRLHERTIADRIKHYTPGMPTLSDVEDEVKKILDSAPEVSAAAQSMGLYFLQEVDALMLGSYACLDGAVVQVAGQANGTENTGAHVRHPRFYPEDKTQGPRAQMLDPIAAHARYLAELSAGGYSLAPINMDGHAILPADMKDHATTRDLSRQRTGLGCDFLAEWRKRIGFYDMYERRPGFSDIFEEKDGYIHPNPGEEGNAIAFLEVYINELRVNVERVNPMFDSNKSMIQVISFAFALGEYGGPGFTNDAHYTAVQKERLDKASSLLLNAQYKLLANIAIIEALKNPEKRIPLILTLVGGGVFGNAPEVVDSAVAVAIKQVKDSGVKNIDVCVSAFAKNEVQRVKSALKAHGYTGPTLEKEQLNKATLVACARVTSHLPAASACPPPSTDHVGADQNTTVLHFKHQELVDAYLSELKNHGIHAKVRVTFHGGNPEFSLTLKKSDLARLQNGPNPSSNAVPESSDPVNPPQYGNHMYQMFPTIEPVQYSVERALELIKFAYKKKAPSDSVECEKIDCLLAVLVTANTDEDCRDYICQTADGIQDGSLKAALQQLSTMTGKIGDQAVRGLCNMVINDEAQRPPRQRR